MPHQCTDCKRTFADGSKEMLSGCPDCGGNKFQFKPSTSNTTSTPGSEPDRAPDSTDPDSNPNSRSEPDPDPTDSEPEYDEPDPDPAEPDADQIEESSSEDTAQASARSDVVSPDELSVATRGSDPATEPSEHTPQDQSVPSDRPDDDDSAATPRSHREDSSEGRTQDDPANRRPGLDDLREELNDQFESIRIVSPGQYELNLMELYDRQEYIISLQEDGRYVIEMPGDWGPDE